MSDDDYLTGRKVYLVVDERLGPVQGTTDRERAYEYAANTGQVVAVLDVATDNSEGGAGDDTR